MTRTPLMLLVFAAAFSGCAIPQSQNTPVPHRFAVDPVTGKGFYYYIPSNYSHDRPWPVVVSCHGTWPFDVAEHHVRMWKMLGERNGCIIIAPVVSGTEGILGDGPLAGMWESERRILSVLSLMGYKYNIDKANIMITGFSGGGFPAYWVGLRHPELFNTVAAGSCNFSEHNTDGWFPPSARDLNVLIYRGENDPAAIQIQSRNAISYLQARGFAVETRVVPGSGHERHPEVAMEYFNRHRRPAESSLARH